MGSLRRSRLVEERTPENQWNGRLTNYGIHIGFPLLLIGLALAATLPLVSSHLGESDSARYVFGLWRWIHFGPAAAGIYDRTLSPGYYAFFAVWLHGLHIPAADYANWMTGASVIAFALMGWLAYEIGRNWLDRPVALAAALLWLFSPGCWWLGIEPHPQGVMMVLALAALWLWTRALRAQNMQSDQLRIAALHPTSWGPRMLPSLGNPHEQTSTLRMPRSLCHALLASRFASTADNIGLCNFLLWSAASWLVISAAMLVRGDALLLFPAFPVTAWFLSQTSPMHAAPRGFLSWLARPIAAQERWQRAGSLLIPLLAALAFLAGQRQLLHLPLAQAQGSLGGKTLGYMRHSLALMHGVTYFLSQLAPDGMGPGPLAALLALAGIGLLMMRAEGRERRRWLWLLAAWALPGYLFWFLVMGNNPRHVALFFLPLAWAGMRGWRLTWQRMKIMEKPWAPRIIPAGMAVLAMALIVWGLDFTLIPATSDVVWLISPNLPASLARLHLRENRLREEARQIGEELSGQRAPAIATPTARIHLAAIDPAPRRPHPAPPAPAYTSKEVALWRRKPTPLTPCYLGTPATDPYIESDLVRDGFRFARAMPGNMLFNTQWLDSPGGQRRPAMLRIYEVYGRWEYRWIVRSARPACHPVFSNEFSAHSYRHFFGRAQWRWLEQFRHHKK